MRAGPLRHRCTLQAQQQTPDGMGGYQQHWADQRKVWAQISLPSGRLASVSQQLTATVTAELTCRPAADLLPGRRLVYGGTVYTIEAALPDNTRSLLRLLCSSQPHPEE